MLLYSDNLPGTDDDRSLFERGVSSVAKALDVNPNWLTLVFELESHMNPRAVNGTTKATGLFQFMPATARALGTTVEAIRKMSPVQQLDLVQKYMVPYKRYFRTFPDLYMAVFYPKALIQGWKEDAAFPRNVFLANRSLDLNKDGQVTVGEFRRRALAKVPMDYPVAELEKKNFTEGQA